jgi:hypothetical protein
VPGRYRTLPHAKKKNDRPDRSLTLVYRGLRMRCITCASSMPGGFGKDDDWSGVTGAVDRLRDCGRIEFQQFAQSAGLQAIRTKTKFTEVKYLQDIELARMT